MLCDMLPWPDREWPSNTLTHPKPPNLFLSGFRCRVLTFLTRPVLVAGRTGPGTEPTVGATVPMPVEGQMTLWVGLLPWRARGISGQRKL